MRGGVLKIVHVGACDRFLYVAAGQLMEGGLRDAGHPDMCSLGSK